MPRDEDDGNRDIRLGEFDLEIQATQPGQPDVQDQAAGGLRQAPLQQFCRGPILLDLLADRQEEVADRSAHDWIVVHDKDDRFLGRASSVGLRYGTFHDATSQLPLSTTRIFTTTETPQGE
jgi:hypothetical protein